jgi:hypothetical protein
VTNGDGPFLSTFYKVDKKGPSPFVTQKLTG